MLTDTDARELLRHIAQHDEGAFRRLYVNMSPSVRQMAWSVLKSDDDADEVVTVTFMAVWNQALEFEARGGSTVKTWIVGIARFQSLMLRRKRTRHDGHDSFDELEYLEVKEHGIPGGANWLMGDALRRCANALEPRHRRIMYLRLIEGWTNAEVGDVLGIPEGSIKRLLHEACKLMRSCLRKGGFADPTSA